MIDRKWLVCSKIKDSVYCFPCKIFQQHKHSDSRLINIGLDDWKHLSDKLKSHESSKAHFQSIQIWMELNLRISKNLTIDNQNLVILEKEKNHWRNVLTRVIGIIHYLAKNNDSFRGIKFVKCSY